MTTYTWPTGSAWVPSSAELRVVDNLQRVHESSLSGYVQTQSMPGARWGWGYDMTAQGRAERQALEGYLLRLSGREHRVRLWDHKQPRPRGDINTAGVTLGATAAQFATNLVLAGCRTTRNVLLNGSFEIDSNADGLADGWTRYSAGSVGSLTATRTAGLANFHGSYAQRLLAGTLGSTSSDRQGVYTMVNNLYGLPGNTASASAVVVGTVNSSATIIVVFFNAGASVVGTLTGAPVALLTGYQTLSVSGSCPATAVSAQVFVYQHSNTGASPDIYVDAVQLEAASAPTAYAGYASLLAGDWLGLASGQLLRVVADASGNDAGAMTVEVRHMLRAAASSGTAVTLDKPTALYVRTESGLAMPRMPGNAEPGMSLEFIEVFA